MEEIRCYLLPTTPYLLHCQSNGKIEEIIDHPMMLHCRLYVELSVEEGRIWRTEMVSSTGILALHYRLSHSLFSDGSLDLVVVIRLPMTKEIWRIH